MKLTKIWTITTFMHFLLFHLNTHKNTFAHTQKYTHKIYSTTSVYPQFRQLRHSFIIGIDANK
ncbi:hypothetical protein ABFX02_05G104300 [Erythranthe guttata]